MRARLVAVALVGSMLMCSSIVWKISEMITYCRAVSLGDLDRDGDLDVFLTSGRHEMSEPNAIWVNDGHGRFQDSGQRVGRGDSYATAMGDLDGDGDLDAVVCDSPSCARYENLGGGYLSEGRWLGVPDDSGAYRWAVVLGDLDDDGDLDLYAAGCCGTFRMWADGAGLSLHSYDMVWLNDGAGNLHDSGQRLGAMRSEDVALGDLDGDGDLDAVTANSKQEPDAVWMNDGQGRFSRSGQAFGREDSRAVALGDVDGDGDLDVLIGSYGPNRLWLNDGTGAVLAERRGQTIRGIGAGLVALAAAVGSAG